MLVGNKDNFAIEYEIASVTEKTSELYMYINNINILEFLYDGEIHTTTWNLDELVDWLETFSMQDSDDFFPYECKGNTAAEKDLFAREFDSDDDEEFDNYYDPLNQWVYNHTWAHASAGGIISNVYFRRLDQNIEISWNNDLPGSVRFVSIQGYKLINADEFRGIVRTFASAYRTEWSRFN